MDHDEDAGKALPHVVCMLAEGSYFHGAAAMANSLVRYGFVGHIVVGYRGALPRWEGPVQPAPGAALPLAPGVDIRFVEIVRPWHLGNQKPYFMLRVAEELHTEFASLWYFDVDIVLKEAWSAFARWAEAGVVLVLDMAETYMPANHVFRREWRALAERAGLGWRPVQGYFNAGCIGVSHDSLPFVRAWALLTDTFAADGADMTVLVNRTGKPEFAKMDQDILNAAVQATEMAFGVLGIEAMDAFPSAEIMSHAMVFDKPWSRDYLRDALTGFQADPAHLAYWDNANGPIRSFTAAEWARKRRVRRVARLLGHLKRRTVRDW